MIKNDYHNKCQLIHLELMYNNLSLVKIKLYKPFIDLELCKFFFSGQFEHLK